MRGSQYNWSFERRNTIYYLGMVSYRVVDVEAYQFSINMEIKINPRITGAFVAALMSIQSVAAYPLALPMMNLWDLFVENIFGSFFVAIIFIGLAFFIILMLGGISYFTVIAFLLFFYLAMTIGYGYAIFSGPIIFVGVIYFVYQGIKFLSNL